jgi:hypothetical protein
MSRIGRGPGALRRWGAVGAATASLVAAPAVVDRLPVRADAVVPRALVERVVASEAVAYSGYAESASAIGLPDVPQVGRLVDLLGETSRLRVWYRSPAEWRVDNLTRVGEQGTYAAGTSTWLWDSGERRAIRVVGEPRVRLPRAADLLPPELGRRLAGLVTPEDRVSSIGARRVAGRGVPGVRIEPGGTTNVRRVDLWADPRTGLALRVEVTAKGQDRPVVQTSFLDLTVGDPGAERVAFELPADSGVDVTTAGDLAARLDEELDVPLPEVLGGLRKRATVARAAATYGTGFGIVAVIALPPHLAHRVERRLVPPFAVSRSGPYGLATVVTSPLLTGLLVVDGGLGYVVSGAVPVETLEAVATDLVRR